VAVRADDTAEQLAGRVLEQEHHLYPQAIRLFAEGRLSLGDNDDVLLDGSVMEQPLQLTAWSDAPCS
jgi:phosphoribosylglycinamide formyltransferase-1